MLSTVTLYKSAGIIKIDGVSFCPASFEEVRLERGHENGVVFNCGCAKAVISEADADLLAESGVSDHR